MGPRNHLKRQRRGRRPLACQAVAVFGVAIVMASCGGDDSTATDAAETSAVAASTTAETLPATTPLPDLAGRLMFSRFDESTHSFVSTHVAAADGSGEVELALPGPEGGGRWSHAGNEIAVMTILDDGRIGTAILTPSGVVERILTIPDPTLNIPCVVWSPDDNRLACEGWDDDNRSRTGIFMVDAADGTNLIRLTTPPDGTTDRPGDFTPDGTKVLFKRAQGEEKGQLFFVDTGPSADPQPLSPDVFEDPGRFSPDGTLIATSIDGHLVILGIDGSTHNTIVVNGRFLFGPAWSPTGEWVVYSSTKNGEFRSDLYVSHPDGSDPHQITDTPDNEIVVDWGIE